MDEAGIKERTYPHLFRHSRASYYANKMIEQQLKTYLDERGTARWLQSMFI